MKKVITIMVFILMLLDQQSNAQPVISNGNNWAPIGYSSPVSVATPSSGTGTAGLNQVWDFSTQSFTSIGTMNIVNVGTSTYGSNYPTATSCGVLTPLAGNPLYFYWKISAQKVDAITEGIQNPGVGNDFIPAPRLWLKFPFNYLDTMSQAYQAVDGSSSGAQTITYDGTGTLKLPSGTYYDVVRIKTVRGAYTDYSWYLLNPLFLVLEYSNYNNQFIAFNSAYAGMNEVSTFNTISVYPNPANNAININLPQSITNESSLIITDILGNTVYKQICNDNNSIDVSGWNNGMYFYQVTGGKEIIQGKFIVTK